MPVEPEEASLYGEFLAKARGARVRIRVPQRGAKRELLGTVARNAQEVFAQHKLRRATDHNARARALTALQEALQSDFSAAISGLKTPREALVHSQRRIEEILDAG